jgi:hypothetical protein
LLRGAGLVGDLVSRDIFVAPIPKLRLRCSATETVRRHLPEASAGSVRAESPPTATGLEANLAELERLSLDDLRLRWRNNWGQLALRVGQVNATESDMLKSRQGKQPHPQRFPEEEVANLEN